MGYTAYVSWIQRVYGFSICGLFQDLFNQSHNLGLFKENDNFSTRISPEGVTFYKFKPVDIY